MTNVHIEFKDIKMNRMPPWPYWSNLGLSAHWMASNQQSYGHQSRPLYNSTPRTVQQTESLRPDGALALKSHNGFNTWQQLLRFHGNYKQESAWVCEIVCRWVSQVWTAEDFSSAPSYSITADRIFSPIINIPAISAKQKTPSSICFSFFTLSVV